MLAEERKRLPKEVARQIDLVCDNYESQRRHGNRPNVASLVADVPSGAQDVLRKELAAVEVECRRAAGEDVRPDELAAQFNVPTDFLRSWLEALNDGNLHETTLSHHTGGKTPRASNGSHPLVLPCPFGDYELLEKLGEGGMGTVYRARHLRLERTVALKVVRGGGGDWEDALARFEREMRVIGRLDHPHIVEAQHAGEFNGRLFLVMKLLDGADLARVVDRVGRLPVADACEAVRQAAVGLQYIHEQGLVHRDLKPSNLMLTTQGTVKILDLGLARLVEDKDQEATLTQKGVMMGTVDYVAPEQQRNAAGVTIAADIYSLGCVLYHLLAGKPPFAHRQDFLDKLLAHRQDAAPDLRQQRPDLPDVLVHLLGRMMAKEPGQRFQQPRDIAEALTPLALGANLGRLVQAVEGHVVGPSSVTKVVISPTQWRRRRLLLTTGLLSALGIGLVLWWVIPNLAGLWSGQSTVTPPLPPNGMPLVTPANPVLTVQALRITHFANRGSIAEPRGEVGVRSFATRFGDQVRVRAELSEPAHCFLLAFNPNGREQLCWPADDHTPPPLCQVMDYPAVGQAFNLDDEERGGLQAFILVAARQPLPAYGEWSAKRPSLPWKRLPPPDKTVWRGDGQQLDPVLPLGDQRGSVGDLKGIGPLVELVRQLRTVPGIEATSVVAFPVMPKGGN